MGIGHIVPKHKKSSSGETLLKYFILRECVLFKLNIGIDCFRWPRPWPEGRNGNFTHVSNSVVAQTVKLKDACNTGMESSSLYFIADEYYIKYFSGGRKAGSCFSFLALYTLQQVLSTFTFNVIQ